MGAMAGYKQLGAYEAFIDSTICAMDMSCGVFQISGRFKHRDFVGINCVFAKELWKAVEPREIFVSAAMRVDVSRPGVPCPLMQASLLANSNESERLCSGMFVVTHPTHIKITMSWVIDSSDIIYETMDLLQTTCLCLKCSRDAALNIGRTDEESLAA